MKHLEFFNYMTIFSGFCFGPDSVNFFSIVGFDFLFPLPWKLVLFDVPKSYVSQ